MAVTSTWLRIFPNGNVYLMVGGGVTNQAVKKYETKNETLTFQRALTDISRSGYPFPGEFRLEDSANETSISLVSTPPSSSPFAKLTNPVPGSDWQNDGGYDEDTGLDIIVDAGTLCVAAADGEVIYAEEGHTPWYEDTDLRKFGIQPPHSVLIELDDPISYAGKDFSFIWYTHLQSVDPSIAKADGDSSTITIKAGDPIGRTGIGNKVEHLHVGIVVNRPQDDWIPHQEIAKLIWGDRNPAHPVPVVAGG